MYDIPLLFLVSFELKSFSAGLTTKEDRKLRNL